MFLIKHLKSNTLITLLLSTILVGCGSGGSTDTSNMGDNQTPVGGDETQQRVIVIGAGIAGLNAASILDKQGFDVLVLESRDRIGGRLWTDKSIDGAALDLGASWIHGIQSNPINTLAEQNNIPLYVWNYDDSALYDKDGGSDTTLTSRMASLNDEIMELAGQARFSESTLDDVIELARVEGELSEYSETEINYVVSAFFENEWAAPSRKLSTASIQEGEEFGGSEVIFPEGFDQLTTILAEGLDVRLSHSVTEINFESAKPLVIANDTSFEADYVLVTVPLGVLKRNVIQFTPHLPDAKLNAINALDMGTLNKVYLKFAEAFWQDEAQNIGYISDPKGQFNYWLNLVEATGQPILLGFMAGDEAENMENFSDETVVGNAMSVLRNIYGDDIPEPEQSIVTRWANDAHSYGSYSYLTTEASNGMRENLAASVDNKVYFAGEATHEEYPSTVHGAYLSGQREAEKIIRDSQ